jgi:hypothetical protein
MNSGSASITIRWDDNTDAGFSLPVSAPSVQNFVPYINATANINLGSHGITTTGTLGATSLTGTLTTNAQPNITSVGTLSSLAVTANVTAGNVSLANGIATIAYAPATATGQALTISAANTQGGTGYADVLKITNASGGATNPNKTVRISNTGAIEIVNSAYTGIIATITNSGNLSTSGTITAGAYTPGQVIKDTMLGNSEVTVVSNTIATTNSFVNFITYNYTPVSSSSYLIVNIHISKYVPQGTTDDTWYSALRVDGTEISYGWQSVNDDAAGTSGRSGVLFPLTGRYTNSSTTAKEIQVAARRDSADDNIIIDNSSTAIWLRITEIAR